MTLTRSRAVLVLLALAGLMWIVSAQTWIPAEANPAAGVPGVAAEVGTSDTATSPVLAACAAVVAVTALLLVMFGKVGRLVVTGLTALAALGYAAVGLGDVLAGEATTAWPYVGIVLGVLGAVVAIGVGLGSRSWQASVSRYDRDTSAAGGPGEPEDDPGEDVDPTRAWDSLSRGEDPS